ncbi:nitrate reductase associated protein [Thiomonas sp.]
MNAADIEDAVRLSVPAQLGNLPPAADVGSLLFKFESDYAKTLCCMPMIVRYKLDACRIKLSLQDWQSLDQATRKRLIAEGVDPLGGTRRYRHLLAQAIVHQAKSRLVRMPANQEDVEWNRLRMPDRVRQNALDRGLRLDGPRAWSELDALQRFTLFKLTRPGHKNRNFPLALREFGLCAQAIHGERKDP